MIKTVFTVNNQRTYISKSINKRSREKETAQIGSVIGGLVLGALMISHFKKELKKKKELNSTIYKPCFYFGFNKSAGTKYMKFKDVIPEFAELSQEQLDKMLKLYNEEEDFGHLCRNNKKLKYLFKRTQPLMCIT